MTDRKLLSSLPLAMAERALIARKYACEHPELVEVDEEMLPWIFDKNSGMYLSFDGNYSSFSPEDKLIKSIEYKKKQEILNEEYRIKAIEQFYSGILWSIIRKIVLDRDNHTCQLCGKIENSKLHIHHILKAKESGTIHLDNLITVCPGCHKRADTKLYNPDWNEPPMGCLSDDNKLIFKDTMSYSLKTNILCSIELGTIK